MAITIQNNLYPPLIRDSYMPAFIYNSKCRIYFSLSEYNDISLLAAEVPVQASVRDVRTNKSVLSSELYPSDIKLCDLFEIDDPEDKYKYYILIENTDIQDGFKLNQYYQVQLRFTGEGAVPAPSRGTGLNEWLTTQMEYFSLWSTIVLIYGISLPSIKLKNFKLRQRNLNRSTSALAIVAGTVVFGADWELDKETLKSYKIVLQDYSTEEILLDSGYLYPSNENEFFYSIKYNLQKTIWYRIKIYMESKNLYSFDSYFDYSWQPSESSKFDIDYKIFTDDENGSIRVELKSKTEEEEEKLIYSYESDPKNRVNGKVLYLTFPSSDTAGFKSASYVREDDQLFLINFGSPFSDLSKGVQLIIKRACSKNNFNTWEDLTTITIELDYVVRLIWDDYTIEPGTWYKYRIIRKDVNSSKTTELETDPAMAYTDHIFLTTLDKQLTIKYNPQISNFSIKTSLSVLETIGSQFPYIRREGNTYYKTFSLSGTISYLSDLDRNLFKSSEEDLYLNSSIAKLYDDYNKENNIGIYKDFIRERLFRNAVMDFLYNNEIKLFRSLTEGNILVKIGNISLIPNTSLGRMIYNFSCTVYEIAEPTLENIIKYNTLLETKKEVSK